MIDCFRCKHYRRESNEYPCDDCMHNKNVEGITDYYHGDDD